MADTHDATPSTAPASTPAPGARQQAPGQEVSPQGHERTQEGQQTATAYLQQGREHVLAWQQQLEHQVRQKPLQSLLLAAGVGLLLGLLRRR